MMIFKIFIDFYQLLLLLISQSILKGENKSEKKTIDDITYKNKFR